MTDTRECGLFGCGDTRCEPYCAGVLPDTDEFVTDHEYVGNVCSGFGGKLQCEMFDFVTGLPCRKSPYEHKYYPAKHRRSRLYTNITETPRDYIGRHRG